MKTKFFGFAVTLMAALVAWVGCQKDPDTASANIEIYAESLEAKPEGEELRFNYSIINPVEGVALTVECDAEWVSNIRSTDNFVLFDVAKNDTGAEREAKMKLSYGASHKSLTITQKAFLEPLSLKIEAVDATSVTIAVTGLDEETTWIGQIVRREWFEA